MKPHVHPVSTLLLCASLVAPGFDTLRADDFKTLHGKVFREAAVNTLTETSVTLRHVDGTTTVPLVEFHPSDQRRLLDLEIQRRSAEVSRIQRDLEQRQSELQSLRDRRDHSPPSTPRPQTPASPAPLTPSPSSTPSPQTIAPDSQEPVAARDLAVAFHSDPAGADARFRGRRFRIQGIVQGFHARAFLRIYSVQLDSGDSTIRLMARFAYRSDWKTVYPANDGRRLVARLEGQQRTLLRSGDDAIFLGTCEGMQEGDIIFSGCSQESPALPPKSSTRL